LRRHGIKVKIYDKDNNLINTFPIITANVDKNTISKTVKFNN